MELSPIEWAVLPLKKYAVFSGRAPRAEYWWFYLATFVINIPLSIADEAIASWSPLSSLFSLAIFVPSLAVTTRRLHDTNRSGWWQLIFLVPIFAIVASAIAILGTSALLDGTEPSIPSGSAVIVMVIALVAVLVGAITMLVFMVSAGTEGPNDYGEDPYGPDGLAEVFA
ncbi:MAG TPA: DUF805 domain-containing protein [Sphingomicrobium sp.]